ncbi:LLM class flavin-dependent oxidoreductase [soil metagenome]
MSHSWLQTTGPTDPGTPTHPVRAAAPSLTAMRHALFVPIFGDLADPVVVAHLAADAELAGWDGLFVWDHIAYRDVADIADPWITLAAAACATEHLRLGPMVTPLPRRRPLKLAREVATLDRLTRGRVTLGVGIAGDNSRELSATGEELSDRTRAAMLDEGLDLLEAAWAEGPTNHRGTHYVVDDLLTGPRPLQRPRPPIWVAIRYGNQAPIRRAARYEGVFPVQVEHPDQLAEIVDLVRAERTDPTAPYDVAVGGEVGTDPRSYEAVGATWFLTSFSPFTVSAAEVRSALEAGPPR